MPGLDALLLSKGYTLPGQDANVITEPGGDPQIGGDISPLGRVLRLVQAHAQQDRVDEQQRQQKLQEQASTYRTLREAGYSPSKAHDAVMNGLLPKDAPGDTAADIKTAQEKLKTDAEITKSKAESTKLDAETGKIKADTAIVGEKKNTIESKILNKLAGGQELNAGEQKIYDDVIKKKNNGGLAELLSQMDNADPSGTVEQPAGTTKTTIGDPKVPVVSPDGKLGYVPQSKLEAAIKKGYKKR